MKKSMRLLVASGILASASLLSAHAEKTVEVKYVSGEADKIPLNLGTRIAFRQMGIEISNEGESSVSIPYLDIHNISFGEVSGVKELQAGSIIGLRNNPVGDILQITRNNDQAASLRIVSLDGKSILSLKNWQGEDIDVSSLNKGIYMLTINNNTIKFIKK